MKGYCSCIQLQQDMPKDWSCCGSLIQDRMGSGKRICPPDKNAPNSVGVRQAVLQWDSSSASTLPLDERLGVHSQWIVAPRAAATTLAALTSVVAQGSFLDLPLGIARVAAKLSTLKSSSMPNHLQGSMHRVARNERHSRVVLLCVVEWPRESFFAKKKKGILREATRGWYCPCWGTKMPRLALDSQSPEASQGSQNYFKTLKILYSDKMYTIYFKVQKIIL